MKSIFLIFFLVLVITPAIILPSNTIEASSKSTGSKGSQEIAIASDSLVLQAAAELLKTKVTNLQITNSSIFSLKYLGESYRAVKVFNKLTSETHEMTFDSNGNLIDYEAIFHKNQETKFQKMGNLHPTLHAALKNNQLFDEVEVIIKIKVAGLPGDKSQQTKGEPKNYQKQLDKALEDFKRMAKEEKLAGAFTYYPSSPFVTAILSVEEIKKLAKSNYVDFIGLHGEVEILDEREK